MYLSKAASYFNLKVNISSCFFFPQAAEQPAPLDEYMAQRVEWTPVMLASKLRAGISQHDGAGATSLARYASDGSALDGFTSPVTSSPSKSAAAVSMIPNGCSRRN